MAFSEFLNFKRICLINDLNPWNHGLRTPNASFFLNIINILADKKKWQFHKLKMYSFLPVLKLMKTFSFFQVSSLFTIYRLRMASSFTISTCVWVQRALSYINFGPFVLMSIWYIFVQFWKGKTTKRSQETYPKHLEFCQSEQKNVS